MGTASRGRARARNVVVLVSIGVALALGPASPATAGGKGEPKLPRGGKIRVTDPCSILTRGQVKALFTSVVIRNKTNAESPAFDCAWILKASGVQKGRVVGAIVFPGFVPPNVDAVDVVEDDRANAQLSGPGVVEVPLGRAGFLDKNNARLEVAPNRQFAFSVQLLGADGVPAVLTADERSKLTALATDIAKRGKNVP